jgi:hypothetical protein
MLVRPGRSLRRSRSTCRLLPVLLQQWLRGSCGGELGGTPAVLAIEPTNIICVHRDVWSLTLRSKRSPRTDWQRHNEPSRFRGISVLGCVVRRPREEQERVVLQRRDIAAADVDPSSADPGRQGPDHGSHVAVDLACRAPLGVCGRRRRAGLRSSTSTPNHRRALVTLVRLGRRRSIRRAQGQTGYALRHIVSLGAPRRADQREREAPEL